MPQSRKEALNPSWWLCVFAALRWTGGGLSKIWINERHPAIPNEALQNGPDIGSRLGPSAQSALKSAESAVELGTDSTDSASRHVKAPVAGGLHISTDRMT